MSECRDCDIPDRVRKLEQRCEDYGQAFPSLNAGMPDLTGHRDYHERKIAATRAEEEFWRDLKMDIARKGVVGSIIIILGLISAGIIYTIKQKIGIAP